MDGDSEACEKKTQRCRGCGKSGHNKSACRRAERHESTARRVIIDQRVIQNPHLLNSIMMGIPQKDGLSIHELGKALMRPIGIHWTEYQISRPHSCFVERCEEIKIQFQDLPTKLRFVNYFPVWPTNPYRSFPPNWCINHDFYTFECGGEVFRVKFRDDLSAPVDKAFSNLLKTKRKRYPRLELNIDRNGDKIVARLEERLWLVRTPEDVVKLRQTLEKMAKTGQQPQKLKLPVVPRKLRLWEPPYPVPPRTFLE